MRDGRRIAPHRAPRSRPRTELRPSRALPPHLEERDREIDEDDDEDPERDAPGDLQREQHQLDESLPGAPEPSERAIAPEHLDRLEQRQPRRPPVDRGVEQLHVRSRLELEVLRWPGGGRCASCLPRLARLDVRDRRRRAPRRPGRASRSIRTRSGSISKLVVGDEEELGLLGDLHECRGALLGERDRLLEHADVEVFAVRSPWRTAAPRRRAPRPASRRMCSAFIHSSFFGSKPAAEWLMRAMSNSATISSMFEDLAVAFRRPSEQRQVVHDA